MIIDNKLTSTKASLFYWIMAFFMATFYLWSIIGGISNHWVVFGFGVLTNIIYLVLLISKPYYFAFNDKDDTLSFRFYNSHPFFMKPKRVEIRKKTLVKFEVKKSWGGLRKEIILHQKTLKGNAVYPPISVSALGPQQWQKLNRILNEQVTYSIKFKNKF